jgi:mandelamide amidase
VKHRSRQQCRHSRVQIPIALGATSKLPIGLELDGPAGSDRRLLAIGIALDGVFGRLPPPHRS